MYPQISQHASHSRTRRIWLMSTLLGTARLDHQKAHAQLAAHTCRMSLVDVFAHCLHPFGPLAPRRCAPGRGYTVVAFLAAKSLLSLLVSIWRSHNQPDCSHVQCLADL